MSKQTRILSLATLALATMLGSGTALAQSHGETGAALATTRDTLSRWVETERLISREREDWAVGKDVLEQRIALLESELASLEDKVGGAEQALRDTDGERRELDVKRRALDEALAELGQTIDRLEDKTGELMRSLPDPLRERIEPLARRVPQPSARSGMSLGQRFQNVIGILNEVNKFNSAITVTQELRELPDGTTIEVQALYVGLGQAWYVSTRGDAAGVGRPSPEGWTWDPADELAQPIARAIRILENEEIPGYVPLPVTLR